MDEDDEEEKSYLDGRRVRGRVGARARVGLVWRSPGHEWGLPALGRERGRSVEDREMRRRRKPMRAERRGGALLF